MNAILKKHYKSPYATFNIKWRDIPGATDNMYLNTPAVENGGKYAQFFERTKTMFTSIHGMKIDHQFLTT